MTVDHHLELELTALAALGKLDDLDRRRLAAHLPGCAVCREELAAMGALAGLLGRPVREALPVPVRRRSVLLPLSGVAAAVAAVVAAGVLGSGGPGPAVRHVHLTGAVGAPRAQGELVLTSSPGRTALSVRVSGLPGHAWCTVLVTGADGHTARTASWWADYEGVARYVGSSPVDAAHARSIEVVADDGTPLLTGQA